MYGNDVCRKLMMDIAQNLFPLPRRFAIMYTYTFDDFRALYYHRRGDDYNDVI